MFTQKDCQFVTSSPIYERKNSDYHGGLRCFVCVVAGDPPARLEARIKSRGRGLPRLSICGTRPAVSRLSGAADLGLFRSPEFGDAVVGDFAQRARIYSTGVTKLRPRVRNSAFLSLERSWRLANTQTDPDSLLAKLSPIFRESASYPSIFASASWTNTRHPALAISREDGITLSGFARERWRYLNGEVSGAPSRSLEGSAAAYKALRSSGLRASRDCTARRSRLHGRPGDLHIFCGGIEWYVTRGAQRIFTWRWETAVWCSWISSVCRARHKSVRGIARVPCAARCSVATHSIRAIVVRSHFRDSVCRCRSCLLSKVSGILVSLQRVCSK